MQQFGVSEEHVEPSSLSTMTGPAIFSRTTAATKQETPPFELRLSGLQLPALLELLRTKQSSLELLQNEGQKDWLPESLQQQIDNVLTKSGSQKAIKPITRKDLHELIEELGERAEWLTNAMKKVDTSTFPGTISRDQEIQMYQSKRDNQWTNYDSGSTIVASGATSIAAGVLVAWPIFHNGWAFIPVAIATFIGGMKLGIDLFNKKNPPAEAIVQELEEKGEASYQEPLNQILLKIKDEINDTFFGSTREKAVYEQNKLLQLFQGLKSTRAQVVELSLQIEGLLNDFDLIDSSPIAIPNERQGFQLLEELMEFSRDPSFYGTHARHMAESLECILQQKDLTNQIDHPGISSAIAHLHSLYTSNPMTDILKNELEKLFVYSQAKAEL